MIFKNNYLLLPQPLFVFRTISPSNDKGHISACLGPCQQLFLHVSWFLKRLDPVKCIRHGMHHFVAHLLRPKLIRNKWRPRPHTAPLHISCVLKQSGANTNKHDFFSTALLHISWVYKWSGTSTNDNGYLSTALLHISSVLRCSGTSIRCQGLSLTTFSHISSVLKWSGTSANKHGFFWTTFLHIFCVLKSFTIWLVIFIYSFSDKFFSIFLYRWWFSYQMILKQIICYFHGLFIFWHHHPKDQYTLVSQTFLDLIPNRDKPQ